MAQNGFHEPNLSAKLFSPLQVGKLTLAHRVVMAPLTRVRSPGGIPTDLGVEYYKQRASAGGLLITEGTHPSYMGGNYYNAPGIYAPEHVRAWKKITDAVHARGGYIFCQLWHTGRAIVSANLGGRQPLGPSATKLDFANRFTPQGFGTAVPCETPQPMTFQDIEDAIDDHVQAAKCAISAGFDGVEVQGANGYLLDQFFCDNINLRTDIYGGSIPNRARLTLEVLDAVTRAVGAPHVAIRLSPFGTFQGAGDSDPIATWSYLLREIDDLGLAYVCLTEPRADMFMSEEVKIAKLHETARFRGLADAEVKEMLSLRTFRKVLKKTVMFGNGGFTDQNCFEPVERGDVDAVVFGKWFISNPDLAERLRSGKELAAYKRETFYMGGPVGYVDYPVWGVGGDGCENGEKL